MRVNITKLHQDAEIPLYATKGAACFDIKTIESGIVLAHSARTFRTGLAVAVPQGFVLKIYSRSGHGFKHGIRLGNVVGIVDPDYRGEIMVRIHNDSHIDFSFEAGDRIAQALVSFVPHVEFELLDSLDVTERGAGGFGHTG